MAKAKESRVDPNQMGYGPLTVFKKPDGSYTTHGQTPNWLMPSAQNIDPRFMANMGGGQFADPRQSMTDPSTWGAHTPHYLSRLLANLGFGQPR